MTFITRIIFISSLISTSAAFTALSISNVGRRFANESTTAKFYINKEYSYDIGIGKNRPHDFDFETEIDDSCGSDKDIYEAARFMVQHESIQKFPSPLDPIHQQRGTRNDEKGSELNHARKRRPKALPKVEPKRQLEDVLFILDELDESSEQKLASTSKSRHPVMIQPNQNRQIDINSIWVEMLIHDQQNAAIAALQRA